MCAETSEKKAQNNREKVNGVRKVEAYYVGSMSCCKLMHNVLSQNEAMIYKTHVTFYNAIS